MTDTGLDADLYYSYAFFTRDHDNNTSPTPVTITSSTDVSAPGPVTGLAVTSRAADSIGLSWTNPGDGDLAAIIVRRAEGEIPPATATTGTTVTLGSPTATAVTDTGLTENTTYSYAVFTRDTTGNTRTTGITITTSTDITPPGIPTGLRADPGDGQVSLTWDPVTDPYLKDYQVFQGPSASGPWTPAAGSPTTNTTLTVTGLTNTTAYWFTITARDTTGNTSTQATPVSATPTLFPAPGVDSSGNAAWEAIKGYFLNSTFTNCPTGWPNCLTEERYGHFANYTQVYCRLTGLPGADITNYPKPMQILGAEQKANGAWGVSYSYDYGDGQDRFYTWFVQPDGSASGRYWYNVNPTVSPPTVEITGLQWIRGAKDCSS